MVARPYTTICISAYVDDLAAMDAFVGGTPGLTRSMLIRLALGAVGVIPTPDVKWPTPSESRPRDVSQLVQATFITGTTLLGHPAADTRHVQERKPRRPRKPRTAKEP